MSTRPAMQQNRPSMVDEPRTRLLADLPVTERRLEAAGIPTAVLEGGEGPPILLLHGPGEFAAKWMRVIPDLVADHRVIAPDLPGHGSSEPPEGALNADRVLDWLGGLIEQTCPSPPALVGHVLGAIAARFAIRHGQEIDRMVLVDTLGLAPFRPAPMFALTMAHFLARPTERTFIEDVADDPARDRPEAFLRALRAALDPRTEEEALP